MTKAIRNGIVLALMVVVMAGCSTMTGKTAGETVDDAKITTMVKTELAKEKAGTLTKVDVDTNRGTVYLNGTVSDEAMRTRAADIARRVAGVREVVNNLKVQ
jgi:osmotically-inducible protein OsmY